MDYIRTVLFFLILALAQYSLGAEGDNHDCGYCRGAIGASVHGSTGKWKDKEVPHCNWDCVELVDLKPSLKKCEMCEVETIRYSHSMSHENYEGLLKVGCICAGHMEGNLESAKKRHKSLVSVGQRRDNWSKRKWKKDDKGVYHLKTRKNQFYKQTHQLAITPQPGRRLYQVSVDNDVLETLYSNLSEAKYAAFDYIWPSHFKPQGD